MIKPVTQILAENAHIFPDYFIKWLPENRHIWDAFVDQAKKVMARGYTHYSSRTILEFLRHHTLMQENGGEWKINNNMAAYLPRLFDLAYPHRAGLFEYRVTKKEKGDAQ